MTGERLSRHRPSHPRADSQIHGPYCIQIEAFYPCEFCREELVATATRSRACHSNQLYHLHRQVSSPLATKGWFCVRVRVRVCVFFECIQTYVCVCVYV